MAGIFKFTFGPWNIHEGADPFGPMVRKSIEFSKKLEFYKKLGFDGVQFHDDNAVPDMNNLSPQQIISQAKEVKKLLKNSGLAAELVAPRLWEDKRTIDGGYTSNDPECRNYAIERSKRSIDIANALGTNLLVLWLAREGTYIRESKDSKVATERIVEAINTMLAYDPGIRVCIELKPNEPMKKGSLRSFLGLTFFRLPTHYNSPARAGSNSNAYLYPSLRSLKNDNLFPKKIWWHLKIQP